MKNSNIKRITSDTIMQAAKIYSESWQDSHKNVCSANFLALHTSEYQKDCLETEIAAGSQVYMLIKEKPVGIVSIHGSLVEHLYVLPSEQNKGYGTQLLAFAVDRCTQSPTLWVLSTNDGARRFYERNGFRTTGKSVKHTDTMYELEFQFIGCGRLVRRTDCLSTN